MANDLMNFLNNLSDDVEKKIGKDPVLKKIPEISDAGLNGTIDEDISIPIVNGYGSQITEKKTTFWVKIKGNATIKAPENGYWHIKVTDLVKNKIVVEETHAVYNKAVNFNYKTDFNCQLKAEAWWSENKNTTLKVHIHATY